jgi:hypothetical protein
MAFQLISASGTQYQLLVNADGSLPVTIVNATGIAVDLTVNDFVTVVASGNFLPISGTVSNVGSVAVTSVPLTQIYVSGGLPLPSGAATENTLASIYSNSQVLEKFAVSNKDDDASPNYYGFEDNTGSWYILKETVSAGNDSYQYVAGSSAYSTAWTNRASQSYASFSSVF